jgi:putative hemolysin
MLLCRLVWTKWGRRPAPQDWSISPKRADASWWPTTPSVVVGVNKHGKNPKENLRLMDEIFASDQCVLFFPAGLVSRRQGGVIKDLEWQKSFVAKAIQYQKPIVPAFIGGRNSNFFYTFANWRKRLGIKSNIEMFFLVDEIYKQRNQTVDFHFGPAIPAARFTKEKNHAAWAQALRDHIYTLPQGNPTHF